MAANGELLVRLMNNWPSTEMTANSVASSARALGTRLLCSQLSSGKLIMAMNTAMKKGRMTLAAAFMPAMTTTTLATTSR